MTLVILAAGRGSRFGGLKQLEPVGPHGETLMEYTAFDALRAGMDRVVVIIRPEHHDLFVEATQAMSAHMSVLFAYQTGDDDPRPVTGTAQALRSTSHLVTGRFLVVNADDHYGPATIPGLARFDTGGSPNGPAQFGMAGFRLDRTLSDNGSVSRGICQVSATGFMETIHEHTEIVREGTVIHAIDDRGCPRDLPADSIVSMNCWSLTDEIFPIIETSVGTFLRERPSARAEFFLPSVVNDAAEQSLASVTVVPTSDQWFGMTYREDIDTLRSRLAAMVTEGIYPASLWA